MTFLVGLSLICAGAGAFVWAPNKGIEWYGLVVLAAGIAVLVVSGIEAERHDHERKRAQEE
jgi:hypothetical protein